ncbi:MAG: polysaccharide deacetylase family protein, partial [Flavobacteriales bacterium]|nr:polysaccharide deacetylase family protein [Flavobacteriales bacterium]
DHVRHGMAFWWDVLYRERTARGTPHAEAMAELRAWKRWRWEEQERRLADLFGPRALEPAGELDRPLTVDELKAMAASPHVRIGDHTHRHLALPLYTDEEVRDSLRASAHWLQRTIGVAPVSFAYPYGSLDDRAMRLVREAGHRVGLAYDKGPVGRDDLHADGLMRVRRNTLTGSLDITTQCHNLFVGAAPAR